MHVEQHGATTESTKPQVGIGRGDWKRQFRRTQCGVQQVGTVVVYYLRMYADELFICEHMAQEPQ